jgi:hypothetical protein
MQIAVEERRKKERKKSNSLKIVPAAKGSARTPLGPKRKS